ncbi:hypothetical protein PIB30_042771 [Stylosanthes scabra]|uniref:Secreted protein n=1 Tax=Stylosanthes scabra TaxID=79078 RepID=A0ABU6XGT1_9FABA|nr:hypothetical protein [Stylosanthes scabra]
MSATAFCFAIHVFLVRLTSQVQPFPEFLALSELLRVIRLHHPVFNSSTNVVDFQHDNHFPRAMKGLSNLKFSKNIRPLGDLCTAARPTVSPTKTRKSIQVKIRQMRWVLLCARARRASLRWFWWNRIDIIITAHFMNCGSSLESSGLKASPTWGSGSGTA